jgi:hypothetical protein
VAAHELELLGVGTVGAKQGTPQQGAGGAAQLHRFRALEGTVEGVAHRVDRALEWQAMTVA